MKTVAGVQARFVLDGLRRSVISSFCLVAHGPKTAVHRVVIGAEAIRRLNKMRSSTMSRGNLFSQAEYLVLTVLLSLACVASTDADENASNPLAAVNNSDVRAQHVDLDVPERTDYIVEGAYMATPQLKLKYELHYWDTDVTGSSENDWESLRIKPIYFPPKWVGEWGAWKYKWAVGAEWIVDFGNADKGIGSGSDQIAPLAGVSLAKGGTVVVPLVQHFVEYNGPAVNQTAFRLIAIQSLPKGSWGKLDAKLPVDWENDNAIPASAEIQLGRMFTPSFGVYIDGLVGVGNDRPYDWGVGVGLRFRY